MTKTLRAALAPILLVLALASAGCGSEAKSGSDPATVVPAGSLFYMEATIDPDGSQEEAMRSILADLPGDSAPQDKLTDLIDEASKDEDTSLEYKKDIEPWLGDRLALFASGSAAALQSGEFPFAVAVASTDEDAARDALAKDQEEGTKDRQYKGAEYYVDEDDTAYGIVDGFVVLGTEAGFRAAVDTAESGKTISKDERFQKATKDVSDERVGFMYADLPGLLQLASQASGDSVPGAAFLGRMLGAGGLVITARAEEQALVFEGLTPTAKLTKGQNASPTPLMDEVPADAWGAFAIPGFGDALRSGIGLFAGVLGGEDAINRQLQAATGLDLQKDLLSWIGDTALFVSGDSESTLGGGLIIKSKNEAASKQALTKIAAAIARQDPATKVAAARIPGAFGYALSSPEEIPRGVVMAQRGATVALTYSKEAAAAVLGDGGKLTSAPDYQRAAKGLGDGYEPAIYFAAPPILELAESFGASDDDDYADAKPYLTILDYLVAGGTGDGKSSRFRIGFKPHE
jgi:hypothetical protein